MCYRLEEGSLELTALQNKTNRSILSTTQRLAKWNKINTYVCFSHSFYLNQVYNFSNQQKQQYQKQQQ